MDSVLKCLAGLRAKLDQIDEAIAALERFVANAGRRRGRTPGWMRAVKNASNSVALRPKAVEPKPRKANAKRRELSSEGKLAIRVGVALRHWKAANPGASEEDVARQRARIQRQLQRQQPRKASQGGFRA